MEELKDVARCPVCIETARPDSIQNYGMCSAGHLVCAFCCVKLNDMESQCPVCKHSGGVKLTKNHFLANLVLRIATENTDYKCKWCRTPINGKTLVQHENNCEERKFSCPMPLCLFAGKFSAFSEMTHDCIRNTVNFDEEKKCWMFYYTYGELLSLERNYTAISPFILLNEEVKVRAYVLPIRENLGTTTSLGMRVCWMDHKVRAPSAVKEMRVKLSCYTHTNQGSIGSTFSSDMRFSNSCEDNNITFEWSALKTFKKHADQAPCVHCVEVDSHMHFSVWFV